jgi:hypothetical protein
MPQSLKGKNFIDEKLAVILHLPVLCDFQKRFAAIRKIGIFYVP